MSRRREPDRDTLPPADPQQAELGQSKAFEDREQTGPPAADFVMGDDGKGHCDKTSPSDTTPANDAKW